MYAPTTENFEQTYARSAVFGAVVAFALFMAFAMAKNGWVFEYPLDDVYIHLAMAEQIAARGYGVNAGEFASAASSPLYPVLLMPFAGSEFQRFLPLGWNVAGLIVAAWLLGQLIAKARLGRAGVVLAFVAPFALSMQNTAFSGMENMLHTAASLAIVLGLWRFFEEGRVPVLLGLGVLLAPAFRLEGLALALSAAGVVLISGQPVKGLALGFLAVLPAAVFMCALLALGLDPLPNSVTAKLPATGSPAEGGLANLGNTLRSNVATHGGRLLVGLTIVTSLIAMVVSHRGDKGRALIGLAVATSGLAHLVFASTGWLDRYEIYLIAALVGALCLLLAKVATGVRRVVLSLALIAGVLTYAPNIDTNTAGMRAIRLQHGEMARFAKDFVKAPVAVNDLGYVAWDNSEYVLDLFGLASADALSLRLNNAPDGWADALADDHGVRVAMIYDDWVGTSLGPDWVPLGRLVLLNHGGAFLGGDVVSFYARNAAEAAGLQADLKDWAAGLPDGAGFVFEVGGTG
jgi:hypothetical protein